MASDRLCLLTVHAHPDDESSSGSATVARYHSEGVETVLVCCTGGEAGDILNPAMDLPEVRENLSAYRLKELEVATKIIGYDHVEMLGYRDSGMAGTPENEDPRCFARADAAEAVGRLVKLIRKYHPAVVITYGDEQDIYPHPDHLRVHDVTFAAFVASADATAYPDLGEPWKPSKLYYSVWSYEKLNMMHDTLLAMGVESPFPSDLNTYPNRDHRITTRIDVSAWMDVRHDALRAHATQVDPESPMWFGLPDDVLSKIVGVDDYILAESSVATATPEDDLFKGLR